MEDIQRTICSPAHVVDLLRNLQAKVMDKSVYTKVTSWEKGVLGAVKMLEKVYSDFPDVVQPYSMALCLVSSFFLSFCLSECCVSGFSFRRFRLTTCIP